MSDAEQTNNEVHKFLTARGVSEEYAKRFISSTRIARLSFLKPSDEFPRQLIMSEAECDKWPIGERRAILEALKTVEKMDLSLEPIEANLAIEESLLIPPSKRTLEFADHARPVAKKSKVKVENVDKGKSTKKKEVDVAIDKEKSIFRAMDAWRIANLQECGYGDAPVLDFQPNKVTMKCLKCNATVGLQVKGGAATMGALLHGHLQCTPTKDGSKKIIGENCPCVKAQKKALKEIEDAKIKAKKEAEVRSL